jgi:hypothetical protein
VLTDVAVTGDRNVVKREAEKFLKYKDRIMEIHRVWNVRANVISDVINVITVITGATGTVSKSPTQYLSNIPDSTVSSNCSK